MFNHYCTVKILLYTIQVSITQYLSFLYVEYLDVPRSAFSEHEENVHLAFSEVLYSDMTVDRFCVCFVDKTAVMS